MPIGSPTTNQVIGDGTASLPAGPTGATGPPGPTGATGAAGVGAAYAATLFDRSTAVGTTEFIIAQISIPSTDWVIGKSFFLNTIIAYYNAVNAINDTAAVRMGPLGTLADPFVTVSGSVNAQGSAGTNAVSTHLMMGFKPTVLGSPGTVSMGGRVQSVQTFTLQNSRVLDLSPTVNIDTAVTQILSVTTISSTASSSATVRGISLTRTI